MKEIVPAPPALVRNESAEIQSLFQQNVVPSYGRFDLVLSHGSGSQVWEGVERLFDGLPISIDRFDQCGHGEAEDISQFSDGEFI